MPAPDSTAVVLAMHGVPPCDFPPAELGEFFRLHSQVGHPAKGNDAIQMRYAELEKRLRAWPRTPDNDPFQCRLAQAGSGPREGDRDQGRRRL